MTPLRLVVAESLACFAGFAILAGSPAADAATHVAQPTWFPAHSCREAWGGRDLGRFDFSRDARFAQGVGNIGYKDYQKRLAREGVDRTSCYKEWTVLVYMAADNDLNPYALWDIHEMEGAFASGTYAGSTLRTDLLVQADTAGPTGVRRIHVFQSPGRDYDIPKGRDQFIGVSPASIRSPLVSIDSEEQTATGKVHADRLRAFLAWGMRAYPAEHYFVIVWGHGQGWAADPDGAASSPPSRFLAPGDLPIGFDAWNSPGVGTALSTGAASPFAGRFGGFAFSQNERDYLGIPSLRSILSEVKDEVLEGVRPIDLYAADACLMQMAEVAYEISDSVRFIIGSAQVQSYLGLPYRQLMFFLNSGRLTRDKQNLAGDDEAYLLARAIPRILERSLDPQHGQQGRADSAAASSFTMSAISSADLRGQLLPALRLLGENLSAYLKEDQARAFDLQFVIGHTPGFMSGARELGSFVGLLELHLKKEAAERGSWSPRAISLWQAAEFVRRAVDLTVVSYSSGTNYRSLAEPLHLLGFRSLGIWLPVTPGEFQSRIGDFALSSLFKDARTWENAVREILGR